MFQNLVNEDLNIQVVYLAFDKKSLLRLVVLSEIKYNWRELNRREDIEKKWRGSREEMERK